MVHVEEIREEDVLPSPEESDAPGFQPPPADLAEENHQSLKEQGIQVWTPASLKKKSGI